MKDALGHGNNPRGAHTSGIDKLFAEAKARSKQADDHLATVLAAPHSQAVFEKGDRKLLISRSLNPEYDLRATDFDAMGPSSHREYKRSDTKGLHTEIFQALAGGYKLGKVR